MKSGIAPLLVIGIILIGAFLFLRGKAPSHQMLTSFDGTQLAYQSAGSGPTVIFLHAFMIESQTNWIENGVFNAVADAGFHTVWLDARGHGLSEKPHDPTAYADGAMAKDVSALLDDQKVEHALVVGYSMGAEVALRSVLLDDRITGIIISGIGLPTTEAWDPAQRASEVQSLRDPNPGAPGFYRQTADMIGGGDRLAYAARIEGDTFPLVAPHELPKITIPVHVINGTEDLDPAPLAAAIPQAKSKRVPGDHFTATWHPDFLKAVMSSVRELSAL